MISSSPAVAIGCSPSAKEFKALSPVALLLLTAAYSLNFLDRQIVNILAEPIKLEMGLSDKSLGLVTGLSFALFYTVLGIPIARLAERGNRARIIGVCLLLWSGFTALCGTATSLAFLLMARMGVGIGEAGCLPPAHSMIAEYTPQERLARSMAIFQSGSPIGILLGLAVGGFIAGAYGWRAAFLVAGAPGVLLAVVILVVLRDPARTTRRDSRPANTQYRTVLKDLASKPGYLLLTGGAALGALTTYSQGAFIASFFLRFHRSELGSLIPGVSAEGAIGLVLGIILGLGGLLGMHAGGFAADRGAQTETLRRYMSVAAISSFAVVPPFICAMLVEGLWPALLFFTPSAVAAAAWGPPTWAALATLARPNIRATVIATSLLVVTLVGLGLGPLTVGAISDAVGSEWGSAIGLRWGLLFTAFASALSGLLFLLARRYIDDDALSTS